MELTSKKGQADQKTKFAETLKKGENFNRCRSRPRSIHCFENISEFQG